MASDAIGELVSASSAIYCRTLGAFRGWRRSSPRPTPAEFRAECEEQQRYLHRFHQALDRAKAVSVRDIIPFDEWHRRIERIENLANQNERCNFHWERHLANSPELNEWEHGDVDRRIRRAAGQWVRRIHDDFRDEINWWYGLRLQLATPAGEPEDSPETLATAKAAKHTNINARMIATLQKNQDAAGWTARQWATHLNCAESSVKSTDTWRALTDDRELAKAEQRANRPNHA